MSDELRERVARALCAIEDYDPEDPTDVGFFYQSADAAIALVRGETLEEAASEAECVVAYGESQSVMRENIAAAIRALKGKA